MDNPKEYCDCGQPECNGHDLSQFFKTETVTISKKDAEAITSYEEVVGFDPETGEAIWEEVVND